MRTRLRISLILATLALVALGLVLMQSQSGCPPELFDALVVGDRAKVATVRKQRPTGELSFFFANRKASQLREAFTTAMRRGDAATLDSMLRQKPALVNAEDVIPVSGFGGNTPLHLAVTFRNLEPAKILLSHGADVNATNHDGFTPLHSAAIGNAEEAVGLLVVHKARIDAPDRQGATALYYTVISGTASMAKLLLSAGADPNAKTVDGHTPATVVNVALDKAMRATLEDWERKAKEKRAP